MVESHVFDQKPPLPSLHPLFPPPPLSFPHLANVARAVAKEVDGHLVRRLVAQHVAAVLDLERGAQADGDAFPDERKPAQQPKLFGEHVHGAALAAADAGLFAKQLGHDGARGDVLGEGVHVVAVGGADVVVLAEEAEGEKGGERGERKGSASIFSIET